MNRAPFFFLRVLAAAVIVALLWLLAQTNYLLFHVFAEFFSISIGVAVISIAWNSRHYLQNGYLMLLGYSSAFVAVIDLLHTVAYKGMGVFPGNDSNLATQLWLAGRFVQALAVLFAPLFLRIGPRSTLALAGCFGVSLSLGASIFLFQNFPVAYIEGQGLTAFKVGSEYVIVAALLIGLALLYRQRQRFDRGVLALLAGFIGISVLSELVFTTYITVDSWINVLGHLLKILAYYLLYHAIVTTGMQQPYRLIFRELKSSEDALRQSEARLRRLADANIVGILTLRRDGAILAANNAFHELIGYQTGDPGAEQLDWDALTPPEYHESDQLAYRQAQALGKCTPYDKQLLHKSGRRVPILTAFATLEGEPDQFIAYVIDISAQKRAEDAMQRYAAQLERSNRELQDFAYVASHDLQEPLRKIIAFGERLETSTAGRLDETEHDYVQRMQRAAERMRGMIDALLNLSRVTTQAQPFAPVDLNKVMQDVLSDLELRIETSHADVQIEPLPSIHADALQMRQLLLNLTSNAIKFSRPGVPPVVRISAQVDAAAREVCLEVADNGIGMDNQHFPRIFMPFQRLHGRGVYEGHGMGLAIVQKIVERHGGKINVTSAPGQGSTFTIHLPDRRLES